ncbi:MAG: hypothetical protein WCJ74_01715 [bacterium]
MTVRIKTEDREVHEFSLFGSPYSGFAELILAGYSDWQVDVSGSAIYDSERSGLDDKFKVEGWVVVGNKILAYLQTEDSNQIARILERTSYPGETLEQLVNS